MRPGLVILFLLLSACGQRGPLYLPDEPQPEAVMGTGDASGETDNEEDWQDTTAPPAAEGAEQAGPTDAGALPGTRDETDASADDENEGKKERRESNPQDVPGREN